MTQVQKNDGKADTIFHWLPNSVLGGLEVAALTVIQTTPFLKHVVVAGDATGPAVALWREAGAEVVQLDGWYGTLGFAWARRWQKFVRERGVRHLIAWSPTRLPQLLAPLDEGCRCVVHLGTAGRSSLRARLQNRVMRLIYRPACRPKLLACSQVVAAAAKTEPTLRQMSLAVVPNPARRCFFELGAEPQFAPVPPRRWGMVARLDGLKDHRSLIEAVRLLPAGVEFRLELAGDGELHAELSRQVAAAGLGHRVAFLGATSRPQDAMRSWQAFIFSTTEREGFGIAVAEAMAAGLPCVLTDVAVMREVAGDSAYYADPGSPDSLRRRILEVYAHPAEAARRAEQGRCRARSLYSPEAFARQYLSALGLTYPA
jgi:glycosyltransferase involved in cell wall biosynthesis